MILAISPAVSGGPYGTAGWMSDKEMRAILEISSPGHAKGIILGKTEKGAVICLPEDTRLNKHIAVFGASGTMKSRRNHPPGAVPEYPARGIRGDFRSKIQKCMRTRQNCFASTAI